MAYNRDNYKKVRHEYEGKNLHAKDTANQKLNELYKKLPDLRDIDSALAETGLKLMKEIGLGNSNIKERVEQVKRENLELQHDRAECLKYHGYPSDYTDVKYECPICMDTGFVGIKICTCMKKRLIEAGYESSGIGHLIKTQSFETFNFDYYADNPQTLENIKNIYTACKNYADEFASKSRQNLMLCGATGLGKTHLSTSIAKAIIDRSFDVCYDSAQNILGDFEYERFSRGYNDSSSEIRTAQYFNCDLLIIDDLGTEIANQFTVSCLYNLINTRLNSEKSMIINTNLTHEELRKRYADRITSRLFGEFRIFMFYGKDIRGKKLISKESD